MVLGVRVLHGVPVTGYKNRSLETVYIVETQLHGRGACRDVVEPNVFPC